MDVLTKHGCGALCIEITDYWRKRGLPDAVAAPVAIRVKGGPTGDYRYEVGCNVRLVRARDGWAAVTDGAS